MKYLLSDVIVSLLFARLFPFHKPFSCFNQMVRQSRGNKSHNWVLAVSQELFPSEVPRKCVNGCSCYVALYFIYVGLVKNKNQKYLCVLSLIRSNVCLGFIL